MLEKFFRLSANHTTVRTELLGGTTTFFTLSYSLFVQPALLSSIGMDFGSVFVATCLASAFATLLMGLYANFPIALAPAMGHNFFFVFSVCGAISAGGMGLPWETALGGVFIAGLLFLIVSRAGMRGRLLQVIPSTLTHAIPIGIGLLIAFIGFQWSGIIVAKPGVLLGIGSLTNPPVLLSILGLLITGLLLARGNKAAILIGLVATTTIGMIFGMVSYSGWISVPPSLEPTLLKLDFSGLLSRSGIIIISMFFFLALFDTIGTVIGITTQAGLMVNGKLPRAGKALTSDATGITAGALLGTSTITCYVESAAGVLAGARTGLANIATGALFLLSLFLFPLIQMVGQGYVTPEGLHLYPIIAPALIVIGSVMLKGITSIPWDDPTEALPAFLTITLMPLAVSISTGIVFGFISYSLLKLVSGRAGEVHWIIYVCSSVFAIGYFFI